MAYFAGSEYFANQDVIVYSQSSGGWVPARIESCNADDSVTVKYATGHTKLVPADYQDTHLRPADEDRPPPEPLPKAEESALLQMPSLMNFPAFDPPALTPMPRAPSIGNLAGNFAGGSVLSSQPSTAVLQMPRMGSISNLAGNVVGGGTPMSHVHAQSKDGAKFYVNQQVSVFSESSKSWVLAKVTFVAPNGCVTVLYGANQKTLEPSRHHLLSPVTAGSGKENGQPVSHVAPAVSSYIEQPKFSRAAPAVSTHRDQPNFDFFPNSASGQFGQGNYQQGRGNYVSQPPQQSPPPQQAGTFTFDLSQLCNDAQMR